MIQILKLTTGEELIGDVTITADKAKIDKPCILQLVPSRTNPEQTMMGLFPYAVYTEDHSITIDQKQIVWIEKPVKDLYNQYNSAFGSGIQLTSM